MNREFERETYLNKPWVGTPSVYNAPLNIPSVIRAPFAKYLVQTASSRTATVLWVLRECDRPLHSVRPHFRQRLFSHRANISKSYIGLVRGCFRVQLIQELCHSLAL